ncbi:unnamed protein product [Arctogadus glacialis]
MGRLSLSPLLLLFVILTVYQEVKKGLSPRPPTVYQEEVKKGLSSSSSSHRLPGGEEGPLLLLFLTPSNRRR